MEKFGVWFFWIMFRLLAMAGVILFALIFGLILLDYLLEGTGVDNNLGNSLTIGFWGLITGAIVAQFAQIIQEVNKYHHPYPLAAKSARSGSAADTSPNQPVQGGATAAAVGGTENQIPYLGFSKQDWLTLLVPVFLLIVSVALLCFLEMFCACSSSLAYRALVVVGAIVAIASAGAILIFWIVRSVRAS